MPPTTAISAISTERARPERKLGSKKPIYDIEDIDHAAERRQRRAQTKHDDLDERHAHPRRGRGLFAALNGGNIESEFTALQEIENQGHRREQPGRDEEIRA